jgi:hypothetical protein
MDARLSMGKKFFQLRLEVYKMGQEQEALFKGGL